MSADAGPSPPPTAHEVVPGCSLDRRTFLQGTAAAGAATIGTAASTGTVAADDDGLLDQIEYDPFNPTLSALSTATGVVGWAGDLISSSDGDELALHSMAISEKETWDAHMVMMENYLEDMITLASTDARNAIASTWESGGDEHEARTAAIDAIEDYYKYRYITHLEIGQKVLAQHSHIARMSREDSDIAHFCTPATTSAEYTGSGDLDHEGAYLRDEYEDVEFELPNGETHETQGPKFEYNDEDGNLIYEGAVDQEWVDNFEANEQVDDGLNSETTLETEDGDELTSYHRILIPNIDHEDHRAERVFRTIEEFLYGLDEINKQAEELADNYELDFVEDLFEALDNGDTTPGQIRGVEATARHLSGSSDVSSQRFQMAILAQLNLSRSDLSETAHMTVQYDGFTGLHAQDPEDGERGLFPEEHRADLQMGGLLFARDPGDLESGNTYLCDPRVYATTGDEIVAIDYSGETILWRTEIDADDHVPQNPHPLHDGHLLVLGNDYTYVLDATTGEVAFKLEDGSRTASVGPDGTVYAASGDNIQIAYTIDYDAEEMNVVWENDYSAEWGIETVLGPDAEVLYVANSDTEVWAFDTETGDRLWTTEVPTTEDRGVEHLAVSSDATRLYATTDDVAIYDIEGDEPEELDSTNINNGNYENNGLALSKDNSMLAVTDGDQNTIEAYNVEDDEFGDIEWTVSGDHDNGLVTTPDGKLLHGDRDGHVFVHDFETGEEIWSAELDHGDRTTAGMLGTELSDPVDGVLEDPMFSSMADDDDDSVQLSDGFLTIESMQDSDGEEIDEPQTWSSPEYDTYDVEEYIEYLEQNQEEQDALADEDTSVSVGVDNPFDDLGDGAGLLGLGLIGIVILAIVGFVTDLIPGLGD